MASVQWVGDFRTRTISASEWNRVGAPGPTVTWNAENGWSIPESAFTPEQLTILENMSGFWTGQPDGPRPYPPAVNMGSTREQYESLYYREVKEIYEAILAMPPVALDPVVAMGQTQAEARAAIGAVDEAAVTAAVAAVVDGSPGALDTLNELAIALGNDADFAATVTNSLMGKVDRVSTPNQIYIVDATGNQATGTYNNAATPSTFVRRDANSRAQFADPAVAADATNKGYVDTADAAKLDKTVTANQVYATDAGGEQTSLPAGTVGKSLLATNDPVDARTAIGAGTSNLALGTTGTTAKPGNYQPAWDDVVSKPAIIAAGADQAAARAAIGAGTSNLAIGTTGTTAKAGNYQPGWTDISSKPSFLAAGVVGDGTADDRAAFASSDTSATAANLPLMLLPGTYRVASNLTISSPVWFTTGAIIKPDSGVTVTLAGGIAVAPPSQIFDNSSAGGFVIKKLSAPIAVEWFGAKGDGVADDTAPIQAAINTCQESGGGVVLLRSGKFGISAPLNITKNGVKLLGSGVDVTYLAVISNTFSAGQCALNINDVSTLIAIQVSDMTITGDPRITGVSTSDSKWIPIGIGLGRTRLASLRRLRIDHLGECGIRSLNSGTSGPDQTMIEDVKIQVANRGLWISSGHSWHYRGGTIDFSTTQGVYLENVNSIFFEDVDIEWNNDVGVEAASGQNIHFINCTFETNARDLDVEDGDKCHILVGSANHTHTTVSTTACFFYAKEMRNMVRIYRGHYRDSRSTIWDANAPESWVGTGTRGAVALFNRNGSADVSGTFDEVWPNGVNGDIPLIPISGGSSTTQREVIPLPYGKKLVHLPGMPTERAYSVGDLVYIPATNRTLRCITDGTAGTQAGVTATTTAGNTAITLSNGFYYNEGDYITIAGVTGVLRIIRIGGNNINTYPAPDATVSGATVSFSPPAFTSPVARGSVASSATPAINTDLYEIFDITASGVDITSMTSGLTGTPSDGQRLTVRFKSSATRALTWGTSFTGNLLTTFGGNNGRSVQELIYDSALAKWVGVYNYTYAS